MKYKTYYLAFNSPLHLGNHKPESYEQSEEFLRSDTILAAVYATWAKMGHEEWIPKDGDSPFTLSSAFPYVLSKKGKDEKYIHFFPRPKLRFNKNVEENTDSTIRKGIKKIQWLDEEYFEMVINNEPIVSFGKNNDHLKNKYLSSIDPSNNITRDLLQRVTISRDVEKIKDSEPFYMERIFFNDAGLFFMAIGNELDKLEDALKFLQNEGFGTDRTVGNGFFELKTGEIDIDTPDEHNLMTNLSLFVPENKDAFLSAIDTREAAFESIKRGGWITTDGYLTMEKKSILMFAEGGIWNLSKPISGKGNIDLTPKDIDINHKIWRSGKSIFIPIKV